MYAIDFDVPLPERRSGRPSYVYPLADMQVGDSFFVPRGFTANKVIAARVQRACSGFRKSHPDVKFTVAQVTEGDAEGVRAWRVK
jgi:hypothetical protein